LPEADRTEAKTSKHDCLPIASLFPMHWFGITATGDFGLALIVVSLSGPGNN
jgi:hypothetical protein